MAISETEAFFRRGAGHRAAHRPPARRKHLGRKRGGQRRDFLFHIGEWAWLTLAGRPAEVASAEEMKVEVEDGLAGSPAIVDHHAVTRGKGAIGGNLRGH